MLYSQGEIEEHLAADGKTPALAPEKGPLSSSHGGVFSKIGFRPAPQLSQRGKEIIACRARARSHICFGARVQSAVAEFG
jgi:hypothetical protein